MQEKIIGKYKVLEEIGRGGMGVVYKSVHLSLQNRIAAIKTLPGNLAGDKVFLEKFMHEADILAKLQHQNIVSIYDIEAQDKAYYLIMEYVNGKTLAQLIKAHGQFSPDQAATIIRDVALALSHSHAKGIIHRDIKPANIMIDENNVVKVTDFGIARATEGSAATHSVIIGTPKYMPPERITDEKDIDGRSDIYSLGIVFYEMVTGRVPFHDGSEFSVLERQVKEPPPPPSSLIYDFPKKYEEIILKCLEKRKEDRYSDCEELAQDLQQAISGEQSFDTGFEDALTQKIGKQGRYGFKRMFLWGSAVLIILFILAVWMFPKSPSQLPGQTGDTENPFTGAMDGVAMKKPQLRPLGIRNHELLSFLKNSEKELLLPDLKDVLRLKVGVEPVSSAQKEITELTNALNGLFDEIPLVSRVEKGFCDIVLFLRETNRKIEVRVRSNAYGDSMIKTYQEVLPGNNSEVLFSELDAIFKRDYCFSALSAMSALNPVNDEIGIKVETSGMTDRVFKIGDRINICMTPKSKRYGLLMDVNLDGIYLLFPHSGKNDNLLDGGETKCSGSIEVSPPTGNEMVFALMASESGLLPLKDSNIDPTQVYHRWSYDLDEPGNAVLLCERLLLEMSREPFDIWCTKSIFIKTHLGDE